MPKNRTNPLPYVAALAVLAACAIAASRKPAAPNASPRGGKPGAVEKYETPPAPQTAAQRRVVLVSVDGMSAALVDDMPNLKKMFADGAGTMQAEVPYGATTAISHAALFTGADPGVNGVDCEPDEPKCKEKFAYEQKGYHSPGFRWKPLAVKDTLFTAVEKAGYTPVAAVQKGKLVGFFRQDGDETGIISTNDTRKIVSTGCEALKDDKIRLVVLHFKMIDDAGHHEGWLSDRQYREADTIDGQLQQVRECVDRANAAGPIQTLLIVTADHGGRPGIRVVHGKTAPWGHGYDDEDDRLVPWLILGPGIRKGYAIAGRSDLAPVKGGSLRPTMLLIDTVPTILDLLGIPETSIPTLSKDAKAVADLLSPPAQ